MNFVDADELAGSLRNQLPVAQIEFEQIETNFWLHHQLYSILLQPIEWNRMQYN